jgi:hypothetical protein
MGAENAKIESAEKSAETGGHRNFYWDILCSKLSTGENGCGDEEDQNKTELFFADFSFFMHGAVQPDKICNTLIFSLLKHSN